MLFDSEIQEAGQIRAKLAKRLEQIGATQGITKREADRQRARAILAARGEMAELRGKSDERIAGDTAKAYRAAFGIRPDRSAEDRAYRDSLVANKTDAPTARALMAQAVARGDDVAMTALAEYAWQHHGEPMEGKAWIPILETYGESSDAYRNALGTLVSLTSPDKISRFQDKLATEITQPSDLVGNLDYLAADDEPSQSSAHPAGMPWAG